MKYLINESMDFIKDKKSLIFFITLTILLSLTPLYSISYAMAVYLAKDRIYSPSSFGSVFGRIITSTLLLLSSIMAAGLVCWALGVQLWAPIVLVIFYLAATALKSSVPKNKKVIDKGDVVSIAIALIAPIIIFISFQLPNPSNHASYQFVANAWDNSSHILMLQTASLEGGYVYGDPKDTIDKVRMKVFSAYPQGWHLASSSTVNGFGVDFFSPDRQLLSLNAYIVLFMGWYVLTAYCITRISWYLLGRTGLKKLSNLFKISVFFTASIFVQSITLLKAIDGGSANYFGVYVFLAVMIAAMIDIGHSKKDNSAIFILTGISGASAAFIWLLPLPAVALSIMLTYLLIYRPSSVKHFFQSLWENRLAVSVVLVAFGILLAQILIFLTYSSTGGGQITVGRALSHEANQTLLLITTLFTLGVWAAINHSKGVVRELRSLIYTVSPFLILATGIYVYQLFTNDILTYYYGKISTLTYMILGIFFVPAFCYVILMICRKVDVHAAPIVGLAVLGLIFIGTNQQMSGINSLFQRHSIADIEVAKSIVGYVKSYDPEMVRPVVFRNGAEDMAGNLHAKMSHVRIGCENIITNFGNIDSSENKIKTLDECAESLDKESKRLFVVTSDETIDQVKSLNRDNIIISNVP